jgi:hypothetical protein
MISYVWRKVSNLYRIATIRAGVKYIRSVSNLCASLLVVFLIIVVQCRGKRADIRSNGTKSFVLVAVYLSNDNENFGLHFPLL